MVSRPQILYARYGTAMEVHGLLYCGAISAIVFELLKHLRARGWWRGRVSIPPLSVEVQVTQAQSQRWHHGMRYLFHTRSWPPPDWPRVACVGEELFFKARRRAWPERAEVRRKQPSNTARSLHPFVYFLVQLNSAADIAYCLSLAAVQLVDATPSRHKD